MSSSPNIFLVGPMGVGKTTVGKLLADELKTPFFDTDREIESRSGADIPWIFDVEGEAGFRLRESRVLDDLSMQNSAVLATGGGIVLKEENRQILKQKGWVVYLTAPLDLLLDRTSKDKRRPLLQVDDPRSVLQKILEVRDPLYKEVADLVVSTNETNSRQLTQGIAKKYRQMLATLPG